MPPPPPPPSLIGRLLGALPAICRYVATANCNDTHPLQRQAADLANLKNKRETNSNQSSDASLLLYLLMLIQTPKVYLRAGAQSFPAGPPKVAAHVSANLISFSHQPDLFVWTYFTRSALPLMTVSYLATLLETKVGEALTTNLANSSSISVSDSDSSSSNKWPKSRS